jgi:hypothetical protein
MNAGSGGGMPTHLETLEPLVEAAKQWTLARFAAAQTSDFTLLPHRFELCGGAVRRHAVSPDSAEGRSPFDAVHRAKQPTAWAHGAVLTVLSDSDTSTVEREQEVVEILAMNDCDVLAEFAYVIRIDGLPPCLGPFRSEP